MDHEMMMGGPSGTFIGHFGPGLVFIVLGLWWIIEMSLNGARKENDPIERTIYLPLIKIFALFVGGFFEIPNSTWFPMDWVMGWHHTTVYMAFALSGVVDLLARKEILSQRTTYVAFAGACLIGALLFFGHGIGPGVEGTCHTIVMLLFFIVGLFTIIEAIKPSWNLEWFRFGAMISLGVWFCITAWLLYLSGWDLYDHVREAQVWLLFSWMILAVTTLTTFSSIVVKARWRRANN